MTSARQHGVVPRPVKVTVVVPVWNPGRYLDPCIDSLLGQSLPPEEFEVVFVDDGSTDDAPGRLDALAAEHPTFRVIHIPNSGWPGRPRNVGVEAARGEYVQFVDQDDHLAPEALERLHAMATRNDADIVIGRVTSDFRGVPSALFRRDREAWTIADAPLIDSLTPHKLFRRAFLQEHAIVFPEGRRRLEDQLFVIRAYFRARVVSVLSSYPCYFYMQRADDGNAGSTRIDPPGYYANLGEVLDVVVGETVPGPFRDRLLRRFYRVEMLGRLSDEWYLAQEPAYQDVLFRTIRALAIERMDEDVEAGLPALYRLRAGLLRRGDPDAMQELARRTEGITASAAIRSVEWVGGRLNLSIRASWTRGPEDQPVALIRHGDRLELDPALTEGLGADPLDVTDEVVRSEATASVRHLASRVSWEFRTTATVGLEPLGDGSDGSPRLGSVIDAVASLDPAAPAGGQPLDPGSWETAVRVSALGLVRRVSPRVEDPTVIGASLRPALVGTPARLVQPRLDRDGLRLEVDGLDGLQAWLVGRSVRVLPSGGRTLAVALTVAAGPKTEPLPVSLIVETAAGRVRRRKALLIGRDGALTVTTWFGIIRGRLPAGTHRLSMRLPGDAAPLPLGTLRVNRDGRAYVDQGRRIGLAASGIAAARRALRATARRLPEPVKARLRRIVRS